MGGGEIQFSLHILEKMIRLRTLVLSNVDIGEPAISVRSCWLCPYWWVENIIIRLTFHTVVFCDALFFLKVCDAVTTQSCIRVAGSVARWLSSGTLLCRNVPVCIRAWAAGLRRRAWRQIGSNDWYCVRSWLAQNAFRSPVIARKRWIFDFGITWGRSESHTQCTAGKIPQKWIGCVCGSCVCGCQN